MSTQDSSLPPRDDDPMAEPRRLTRSTENKYVAGVAGGLGRYFGLDPVLFRVAFGVSMVFGGIGIVAYIALWVFLPTEDGEEILLLHLAVDVENDVAEVAHLRLRLVGEDLDAGLFELLAVLLNLFSSSGANQR